MTHKILLNGILVLFLLGTGIARAEERIPLFSPALFTGTEYYRGNTKRRAVIKQPIAPIVRQRTVIRFQEGVTALDEEQKKQLLPFIERAQQEKISEIQLTAFSKTYYHSYLRILSLQRYFKAYVPKLNVRGREANVDSVMESNNNTVDVVEIR